MTDNEALIALVDYSDQLYQLHLVGYGFMLVALGWIAGHQR